MDSRPEHVGREIIGHETRDIQLRPILWALVGLIVLAISVHVGIWWLFDYFAEERARREGSFTPAVSITPPPQPPPGLRLQSDPHLDLAALLHAQNAILESYGWVDQGAGMARIPIARAMELVLERGLPARQSADGPIGGKRE